jgi:hypothetical protein
MSQYHRQLSVSIGVGLLILGSSACFDISEKIDLFIVQMDTGQAELRAEMIFRDAPIDDGTNVTFITDKGSFDPEREIKELRVAASGGAALVTLFRACDLSPSTISASFRTANATTPSAQVDVAFQMLPPLTNRDLGFTCAATNIAALDEGIGVEKIEVPCSVSTPRALVSDALFAAEAGRFVTNDTGRGGRCALPEIKYTVFIGDPEDQPHNVAPLPHQCIDALSHPVGAHPQGGADTFRNPRDGLVTLTLYTAGSEGFDDNNGDGMWNPGEPFDDLEEPYVDADDTGAWEAGEWYFDSNDNGRWDPGNGRYDAITVIWRRTHILWTGAPWTADHPKASRIVPITATLDSMNPGDGRTLDVRLVDRNLNPVASHSTGDRLRVEANRPLELVYGDDTPLSQSMGMAINAAGLVDHQVEQGDCSKPIGRVFPARVRDTRDSEGCEEADVSVSAEVRYTPAEGVRQRQVQLLPLEGRLRACQ